MNRAALTFFLAAIFAWCSQAAPVLTTLPASGTVSGSPGGVVGWGFTLSDNTPSEWVLLTGSQFTGSPIFGTYIDYLSSNSAPAYVVGPSPESSTIQVPWNHSTMAGLGEFDINSTAAGALTVAGNILVHYSVFSQDPLGPNFNPDTATLVADATVSVPAQVNIAPEPDSAWIISALLPLAWLWRRRALA
ncbi:MAG: hypothetical protein JO336_12440 [Acidobacteriia bacterium]|nr:hypothetical protein [Terriglobia bacterium]